MSGNKTSSLATPYVRPIDKTPTDVTVDKTSYAPRSPVKLTVNLPKSDLGNAYTISVRKKYKNPGATYLAHQFFVEGWDLPLD
mgnify:CR=1 FL=1